MVEAVRVLVVHKHEGRDHQEGQETEDELDPVDESAPSHRGIVRLDVVLIMLHRTTKII